MRHAPGIAPQLPTSRRPRPAIAKEFQPVVDYTERVQAAVGAYCREVV
jgi:hypothetical protein